MKVYKSKPRYHWVSPYKICETICFWREIDYDEPWVKCAHKILQPLCTAWMKFLDFVHPQVDYVKIDYWDVWSMDHSLSNIILPMLIKLKEVKHGAGFVDDEDVPPRLRSTTKSAQKAKKNSWDTDGNHFKRYDYILDEMIWAFTQLCDEEHDAKFFTGETDHQWEQVNPEETEKSKKLWKIVNGPNHTRKFDKRGFAKHHARIQNGTRLFGKYFQTLWD